VFLSVAESACLEVILSFVVAGRFVLEHPVSVKLVSATSLFCFADRTEVLPSSRGLPTVGE
jgi:hypothetical protein